MVAKAEYLPGGENPRFIVTSLSSDEYPAKHLYTQLYCARGEMENRIKEQQLFLFADRTSSATMRANQLRLWFSAVAYVLMNEVHRAGDCPPYMTDVAPPMIGRRAGDRSSGDCSNVG